MKKRVLDYLAISFGAFLLALGMQFFLVPARFTTGGAGGVATILYYFFRIPVFLTVSGINLILFLFGFRFLPREAILKNLWGILFLSFALSILPTSFVPTANPLLCALFGGALEGVGVGLVMRRDGSTGGTDFAALILHRLFPLTRPFLWVFYIDTCIITLSALAFGLWETFFYSLFALFVSAKVMDRILVQGTDAKSVFIISRCHEALSSALTMGLGLGVTEIPTRGGFSKEEGKGLLCIVKTPLVPKLLALIKKHDPMAFTVISDVRRVHGEGFYKF